MQPEVLAKTVQLRSSMPQEQCLAVCALAPALVHAATMRTLRALQAAWAARGSVRLLPRWRSGCAWCSTTLWVTNCVPCERSTRTWACRCELTRASEGDRWSAEFSPPPYHGPSSPAARLGVSMRMRAPGLHRAQLSHWTDLMQRDVHAGARGAVGHVLPAV